MLVIIQVSHHTALSLAKHAMKLQSLDLSWCREMTDEALGLIVDSCLSLKMVKLFGCTQITNVFTHGHSNENVKIVGLQESQILKNIVVPDLLPLRYSSVWVAGSIWNFVSGIGNGNIFCLFVPIVGWPAL